MQQPAPIQSDDTASAGRAPGGEAAEATRGSAIKLGAEMGGRVLSLLTTLLLARGLGVADFGVFSALSGIAVIVAEAGDLGLQATAARALVARSLSLGAMLRAKLLLSALTLAIALALSRIGPLLAPLVLYFTLLGWSVFLGVSLRARGRRGEEAGVILCLRASTLASVVLALRAGAALPALAWSMAASTLLPLALALGLAIRGRAHPEAWEGAPPGGVRSVLRTAFPLGVNGALSLLSLRIELFALAALRSAREAGLFAAALRAVEFLNMVPEAICAGAMPALTREALKGEGQVRGRTAGTVALLAFPAAAGLVLVAPGLVPTLFGVDYADAVLPLRLLGACLVVLFMNAVMLHALIAAGRAGWLPRLTAGRVAAASLLAALLVPTLGPIGAALGFLVSELLLFGLAAHACAAARFEVPLLRPLLLGLGAATPMVVAVVLASGGLAASIALGIVTYLLTLAAALRFGSRLLDSLGAGVRLS